MAAEDLSPDKRALLARRLKGRGSAAPAAPDIRTRTGPAPLSFAQQRLWFLHQWEPDSPAYNVPRALRVTGPLDVPALERALGEVVRRHEVLRTRYPAVDGQPVQEIVPYTPLALPLVDLAALPPREREARAKALADEEAVRPLDIVRGPVHRFRLLRLAAEEHVLLLTFHHIAFDGWSAGVLVRELAALYPAFAKGTPSPLPELPLQYADHAERERRRLEGGTLERQLARWRDALRGLAPLELPTDRPRPPTQSFRGASHDFSLPAAAARRLHALVREEGATPFMGLLAVFQTLLHRYTGQEDVAVATPIAGRDRPETEALIGFFVNTLVLRGDLSGAPTFRELLRRTRERCLDAYANAEAPFERVVEELQPVRDLSRAPLVQAMFALENAGRDAFDLEGATVRYVGAELVTAKLDLTLAVRETQDGLRGSIEYAIDLFDAETVARLAGHFGTLLDAATAQPDAPVPDLPILAPEEERRLLGLRGEREPLHDARCIHEIFAERAARSPDRPAIRAGDDVLTFGELDARAERLARRLRARGVAPGTLVALCLERSVDLAVGILGVWKAGGAYVPLDPAYPAERLAFMLADTAAPVLVTHAAAEHALPPHDARVVRLDAEEDAAEALGAPDASDASAPRAGPDDLAYVIYTSGSTGKPKGVMVEHRALANLRHGQAKVLWQGAPRPDLPMLWTASVSFDPSLNCIILLADGHVVHVASDDVRRDPADLVTYVRRHRVGILDGPPSQLALWLDAGLLDGEHVPALLMVGGEAMDPALWERLARLPRTRVVNAYGPTECTVEVTLCPLADAPRPSLGRPIPNVEALVLDARMRLVPVGVPGELYLGGACLARGYLNRPELTAERFAPHPFSSEPGARLYRTGDLARLRPDGRIEFLGRVDEQLKIRGFRIEPGEVEAALTAHPNVREAVVVAREDAPGDKRLVAYVILRRGPPPTAGEWREFLRRKLPDPFIPSAFVALDAFPVTPTGKLDRKALPAPEAPAVGDAYEAPRTPTEEVLAAVWADVLRVPRVGVQDNFFELGGDSILSIQVVARAARRGVRLTPKQLFRHQTVAELAAVAGTEDVAEAEQGLVTGEAPLTPIQRWLLDGGAADPARFNQSFLLDVPADVDAALLEEALLAVVRHHDALRLRFVRGPEGWRQEHGGTAASVTFHRFDHADLDEDARRAALAAEADRLQGRLDLEHGPLAQAALFHRGPEARARLLLVVHHLVVDGVSWRILLEDLEAAYAQLARGERPSFPPKTTSFKQWAHRLVAEARSDETRRESAWWLSIASTPAPRLPLDAEDGRNDFASARHVTAALTPEETTILLQEVPKAYRTQVNDVLLAALAQAFHRWSGHATLLVDVEGHGREDVVPGVDLTRTVGWFTTLHPLLLRLDAPEDPAATLKAVKEQVRAVPRRGIGYGLLRHLGEADVARALADAPRPEVGFNYLGQMDAAAGDARAFRPTNEPRGREHDPATLRPHALEVSGVIADGRLRVALGFSENLHRPETAERLLDHFVTALRGLLAHCRSPDAGGYTPSDFPLARLDQRALDARLAGRRDVVDLYPLSPMQEGMLFHSLVAPTAGMYFEQTRFTLEGDLDADAFQRAWQKVVDRHPALRTSFLLDGGRPLQAVHARAPVPMRRLDWRGLDAAEQTRRLDELLREDRVAGLDLATPPLLRLALARLADDVHQVVLTSHHAILDGWSMPKVLREVFTCYEAFRAGRGATLPPAVPYASYVAWLQAQDPRAAEAAWRKALDGFTTPTRLAVDRPHARDDRPHDDAAGEVRLTLAPETTAALQEAARRNRVTLNTLVQGAWAVLLSRYSGEEDVLFGATVSGRPAGVPGIEDVVGLLINAVPVRVRVPADAPAADWLRALQAQQAELQPYEHAPLADVQTWSGIPRGVPLFESLLVFENYPVNAPGTRWSLGIRGGGTLEKTNYPLTLVVGPGESLLVKLCYHQHRFDRATVERMSAHLRALLEGLAQDAERPVGDLPLLPEDERRLLLDAWNGTEPPLPSVGAQRVFEAQAARSPGAPAVVAPEGTLAYRDLNEKANRLAHRLRRLGVGRDVLVGVCMERCADMVVAFLAVLKAGGAYVPLDPTYPEERLAFMLEDTRAHVVITRGDEDAPIPDHPRVLRVDDPTLEAEDAHDPPASTTPEDLAYVIYTSGSTGKPKGVSVPHRGILRLVCDADYVRLGPEDVVAQASNASFDAATFEVWGPLLNGGRLVLVDKETLLQPERLEAAIERHGITTLFVTTALFNQTVARAPRTFARLKHLLFGGEAVDPKRVRDLLRASPPERLLHVYGPTETTTFATWELVRDVPDDARTVPIGRPIANTRLHVLDRALRPVPVGVPGELFIGGPGVARGYHERPDLTTERFLPEPGSGGLMYRTGDLVLSLPDGRIEFVGRIDGQVKVRGFRVEPGEVEAALLRCEGVQEAVVVAREDAPGEKRLVAYVVPRPDAREGPSEWREGLKRTLPDHMLPSAFVALDRLPLNANGKVDRKALPAPAPEALAEWVPARTPVEEIVADAWRETLSLERVGVRDDFFALGGHSLLAAQIVSRTRAVLGVDVPLSAIFEHPTVEGFAAAVDALRRDGALDASPIRPRADPDHPAPLSFAQQRLWFVSQWEPDGTYNVPLALRCRGPLDADALGHALSGVLARHEALRTTFHVIDGEPRQVVQAAARVEMPILDLSSWSEADRERETSRLAEEEATRPFDLARGPLLRARLLRLAHDEHVLLLTLHHVAYDGWSSGVLFREVSELYAAAVAGRPPALAPLPIQYADVAAWQRERLSEDALAPHLAYWREALHALPSLEMPTDHPRPPVQGTRGGHVTRTLDDAARRDLRALAREEGVTPFMVALAAFQSLLHRYSGQDDIAVGTPIAGRDRPETEGLIGFFVNTLVLRGDLAGEPSFRDLLRRTRRRCLEAYDHQVVPFERLVDDLQPARDPSRSPLVQAVLTYQDAPTRALRLGDAELTALRVAQETAKFDLSLALTETPEGLRAALEYRADLFEDATAERILRHFEAILRAALAHPERSVGDLDILSPEERRRLLVDVNATSVPYPRDSSVHALFEAQARRAPERVALVSDEASLTYGELDARADRLAARLRALGVGPGSLVGVALERSFDAVASFLAVLKAGGAYVPLDPTYPRERLTLLARDAGIEVAITLDRHSAALPQDLRIVRLDADAEDLAREPADPSAAAVPATALAYVMFTSGSTGTPKGVEIPHRGIVRLVLGADYAPFGPDETFVHHSPLSFDASTFELWGALLHGARVLVLPPQPFSPHELGDAFRRHGVTVAWLTAPLFHLMVDHALDGLRGLRAVIAGGDVLSPPHVARAVRALPGCRVVNGYGPTEGTTFTTCHALARDASPTRPVPIGRPIANTRVLVLDRRMRLVPIGVPGELHVGGDGLARGYLGRPDLTAERFVPDPHAPGERLYRTGDLARRRPDGTIEFLGRIDQQVKVRGFRVEPGEIEAALVAHPQVKEAVVVAREDAPGDKRLVAYAVLHADAATDERMAGNLRAFLEQGLPGHLVPSAFVVLGALPLTPNGKVDRAALPAPDRGVEPRGAHVSPRNDKEEVLVATWAEVLGVPRVGVHDDFFDLGGDSILALQAIARAAQRHVRVTPRQLFQHPTVAALAAVATVGPPVEAEQGPVVGPLPLTPIQRWFFRQDAPAPHHFNQSLLLAAPEDADARLLEEAVRRLATHHDALRLRFVRDADGWRQESAPPPRHPPFAVVDLSHLADAQAQRAAVAAESARAQAGLDLAEGGLLRVVLFDLGAGREKRLLLVAHHLGVDVVSWRIILEDLETTYRTLRDGESPHLPLKTTSFRRWAHALEEHARAEETQAELAFWLDDAHKDAQPLPVDLQPGRGTVASASTVTVRLTPEETDRLLHEAPRGLDARVQELLLAPLARSIARWTRARALLVDVEGHGREDVLPGMDLTRTVGWFTSLHPLLLPVGPEDDPRAALATVRTRMRAVPRQGFGYGLLREMGGSHAAPLLAALPEAEVSFNYLGQLDGGAGPGDARIFRPVGEPRGLEHDPSNPRTHLLQVHGAVEGGRLAMSFTFPRSAFRPETVDRLAADYVEGLRALLRGVGASGAAAAPVEDAACVVRLKNTGSRAPFFCVHPGGGTVACYQPLSRLMDPEQPFVALQAVGAEDDRAPHASFEEMARHYAAQVRAVQPHGPYALGGWSMGGMLALEVARVLRAEGEEVTLLALLDPGLRVPGRTKVDVDEDARREDLDVAARFGSARARVRSFLALPPDDPHRAEAEVEIVASLRELGLPDAFLSTGLLRVHRHLRLQEAHARAVAAHAPAPYDGDVTLLLCERTARERPSALDEWARLTTGRVRAAVVPGDHASMVAEPEHVRVLARHLNEALRDAETPRRDREVDETKELRS